ncbi:2-succinyl-6-hydroxy-2,4-cyclohexadiene-1-carboxylate synthase [Domibacillus epiphyticus]|uniref:Putative 2-succinyl-6-hydroxy-2,4-cyclohexadiene-1-carboxylate synthase n=1 Tax=Domibacillus epiphyticus TaxID=1714355 RepID=A0A1V2A8R7_9BACI|nr:2-succinyl-6-hydroxy-2,4-cyclohexadiene-1-carboxylate synthase [Domibacillus epiphyticus]OMP67391.1 2-succinyl-6-hydroxy-2,4-cyclohexadiene-1-carboxylate synthase [Domibacillus epiphyticus]
MKNVIQIGDHSFYHINRVGKGAPVVFLHGFTGSGSTWRTIAPLIPCETFMPDLAGHGRTKAVCTDLETEAESIKRAMNDRGFFSFHVVGYSMGGRLALAMGLMYPEAVRSLVLESASPGLETEAEREERRKADEELASKIENKGIEWFVDFWENIPMFETQKWLPESIRESVRRERQNQTETGLASSLRGMGTGAQKSYWNRIHELTMPVLLITGSLDHKFTNIARLMKKRIPNCQWMKIDGAGHAIHVEQHEKFGTIVKTFLLEIKGGNLDGF